MSIKTKIVDFLLKNASFPTNIKSGNELDWMLKGNCPCCIAEPIEHLSNAEYHKKYPVEYTLTLGTVRIYLCKLHYDELKNVVGEQLKEVRE